MWKSGTWGSKKNLEKITFKVVIKGYVRVKWTIYDIYMEFICISAAWQPHSSFTFITIVIPLNHTKVSKYNDYYWTISL